MSTHARRFWLALGLVISLVAAAQVAPTGSAPVYAPRITVRDATFHSASLQRDMKYRIVLPAGYDGSAQRYPVLYLLHGLTGSYVDWESRTHLDTDAAALPLIIVMPDADDSWYTNSAANPQDRFEDYIAKDLVAEVDKTYRTIQTRHARAIGGLSMGGYGAMKLALKYPQLFIFAASFSGALDAANPQFKIPFGDKFNQQLLAIYGPPDNPARAQNNVYELARKANPAALPYLWIVCGTEDGLLAPNHEFVNLLDERKIAHYYAESAGGHSWQYWDEQLPLMLTTLFDRYLRPRPLPMPPPRPEPRRPARPQR
jgi:putative tributyrin esterase